MEVRIKVSDVSGAKALVQRLTEVFDPKAIALDADTRDVRITAERASNRTLAQLLDAVEDWLDRAETDSVAVWLDGRSHVMARRPAQIASGQ